ncbi:MAG: hypothetical protein SGI72_00210 [Planctomycetota bacterium]|nr:hypothetical protein [Planctomycetota bacterium]
MKSPVSASPIAHARFVAIAAAALLTTGCMVAPPVEHTVAREGVVRASTYARAARVAKALDALTPQVQAFLPDTRRVDLEVWVQDVPALYEFQASAYSDADGFYAEGARRIHLREGSDHIERTLAHELVHASLGESWRSLPGTLEEGLCDYVSTRLCPESAGRLAAGRLSSAAFATGGLALEIELAEPALDRPGEHDVCWSARLRLEGEPRIVVDPLRVFDLEAGLSSSDLSPAQKKAFYGIAFLVVERIADRVGIEGLHDLCVQANAQGLTQVPAERLLEAAGLGLDRASLRAAIEAEFGPREIEELVRAHPEFLASTIAHYLRSLGLERDLYDELMTLEAFVAVRGPKTRGLAISSLAVFENEVLAAIAADRPEFAGR